MKVLEVKAILNALCSLLLILPVEANKSVSTCSVSHILISKPVPTIERKSGREKLNVLYDTAVFKFVNNAVPYKFLIFQFTYNLSKYPCIY